MSKIKFQCPHCGRNLECEGEHAGLTAECPECRSGLVLPGQPGEKERTSRESGRTVLASVGVAILIVLGLAGLFLGILFVGCALVMAS